MLLEKPIALTRGAKVGIIAPAGPIDPDQRESGEQMLRRLGLEPVRRPDVTARFGYLAGDDGRRAAEFVEMLEDPQVRGIVCARGGYGSCRILAQLDPMRVRRMRKVLVGYSDVTTLLLWQRQLAHLAGVHGPMLERAEPLSDAELESLQAALMDPGPGPSLIGQPLCDGVKEGRLTGGSLSLVVASLGTPWEIDTAHAIVMLEDVTEAPYRIDRMLQQLLAAGKFDEVVGVGLGGFDRCEDPRYPERDLLTLFREVFEPLGVPVVWDLPFGHGAVNMSWPHGGTAILDGERGELQLVDSAVVAR